jgi:hypothetical protein
MSKEKVKVYKPIVSEMISCADFILDKNITKVHLITLDLISVTLSTGHTIKIYPQDNKLICSVIYLGSTTYKIYNSTEDIKLNFDNICSLNRAIAMLDEFDDSDYDDIDEGFNE